MQIVLYVQQSRSEDLRYSTAPIVAFQPIALTFIILKTSKPTSHIVGYFANATWTNMTYEVEEK